VSGAEFLGELPDALGTVLRDENRDLAQPPALVGVGMRAGRGASARVRRRDLAKRVERAKGERYSDREHAKVMTYKP
jgi:hypothetical protein